MNELGLGATPGSAPAPIQPQHAVRANGKAPIPEPVQATRTAEVAALSDSDNEEEVVKRGVRNDGTLLASDPPKPL